jgi:hypothetical protein
MPVSNPHISARIDNLYLHKQDILHGFIGGGALTSNPNKNSVFGLYNEYSSWIESFVISRGIQLFNQLMTLSFAKLIKVSPIWQL